MFPTGPLTITHNRAGDVTCYELWRNTTVLPFVFDAECGDVEQLSSEAKDRNVDISFIINSVFLS